MFPVGVVWLGGLIAENLACGEHLCQLSKSLCLAWKLLGANVRVVPVLQHKNFCQFRRNTGSSLRRRGENLIPIAMSEKTTQLEDSGTLSLDLNASSPILLNGWQTKARAPQRDCASM